jgi:hypothetical protein
MTGIRKMKKPISPIDIIILLEEPNMDRRPLKHQLKREAYLKNLIQALRISKTSLTRRILCDIIGYRHRYAKTAVPVLIECLDDQDWKVRSDAAEALSKIGGIKAGKALLNHLEEEELPAYIWSLGSLGYHDAIPVIEKSLRSNSRKVRAASAWSLSALNDFNARILLIEAIKNEKDKWVKDYMQNALDKFEGEK